MIELTRLTCVELKLPGPRDKYCTAVWTHLACLYPNKALVFVSPSPENSTQNATQSPKGPSCLAAIRVTESAILELVKVRKGWCCWVEEKRCVWSCRSFYGHGIGRDWLVAAGPVSGQWSSEWFCFCEQAQPDTNCIQFANQYRNGPCASLQGDYAYGNSHGFEVRIPYAPQ